MSSGSSMTWQAQLQIHVNWLQIASQLLPGCSPSTGNFDCEGKNYGNYKIVAKIPEGKILLRQPGHKQEDTIKLQPKVL
jgi:hypothetical protein